MDWGRKVSLSILFSDLYDNVETKSIFLRHSVISYYVKANNNIVSELNCYVKFLAGV